MTKYDQYYILGFGLTDYVQKEGKLFLNKDVKFKKVMEEIAFRTSTPLKFPLEINTELRTFLIKNGVVNVKKYMPIVSMEYQWAFAAGCFDGYGDFSCKNDSPRVTFQSPLCDVVDFMGKLWKCKSHHALRVTSSGYKALDLCGMMYKDVTIRAEWNYNRFLVALNGGKVDGDFEYKKLHPNAKAPAKSHTTDSGYDLHIIELSKLYTTPWGASVYQGKTGLAVKPIFGQAFDVNGRSNLPKKGWVFLQGTGIVDRSYVGEVQATFMKLNDEPLPVMPWKAIQLVPREAPLHANFKESKELGESFRGSDGFGSTG